MANGLWLLANWESLAGVTATRASAVHGGNVYLFLVRSKQQRGLSATFGWRLTPRKMTDMWVVSACRACVGPLISAGGSHGNSRLGGPWRKCILFLVRSKQQRGLSTTFGRRLVPLKMTDM